jgi:HEPN domain-containing protein
MNEHEFSVRINEIDRELAARGMSVPARSLVAVLSFGFQNRVVFPRPPRDRSLGSYDGPNLQWAVAEWYAQHYGPQVAVGGFGKRLLLIRGHVFFVTLPAIFNPEREIPALGYVENISESLVAILTDEEKGQIQWKFNTMFNQASRLALLSVKMSLFKGKNANLANELLTRGLTDLHASVSSFIQSDPTANVWSSQQAAEKFLKAYLAIQDDQWDETNLRKRFSHDLVDLLAEVTKHEQSFSQTARYVSKINLPPSARYDATRSSREEAVEIIDIAHAICDLVAQILLHRAAKL